MTEIKMKLAELDAWYKDNEIPLDDYMRSNDVSWNKLTYEKKLQLCGEYLIFDASEKRKAKGVANNYQTSQIGYFQRNKLNHSSGDYRTLGKKFLYVLYKYYYKSRRDESLGAFMRLCELNNLHQKYLR